MRRTTFILIILTSLWFNLTAMKHQKSFYDVKKISCDLYVGKVADKFYLAMERIDQDNIDDWLKYAKIQTVAGERMNLKYLPTTDGSGHFKKVLNFYKEGKIEPSNELWVAYAYNKPVTKKFSHYFSRYSDSHSGIEMFLTVITSPKALLTSHMGISRTWQAALDLQRNPPRRKKHPYQSVHLHSFAAKVIKSIYPEKVYMLTAPNNVMRKILLKKMPEDSIFVGDDLYKKELEEAGKNPKTLLTERDLEIDEKETAQEREKRLEKEANCMYEYYKCEEKLSLLKTNPPRIIRIKDSRRTIGFKIQDFNGKPIFEVDNSDSDYQWIFTEPYRDRGLSLPYVLVSLDKLAKVSTFFL